MTDTNEYLKFNSLQALYSNEKGSLVQGIPVASTNVVLESRGATVTGYCDTSCNSMYCIDGKEDSHAFVYEYSLLTIKLGQPHWLSSLRIRLDAMGNSYTIESSHEGESWQPVGGERKGEEGRVWRTFNFSSRAVLHFRVTVKQIHSKWSGIDLFHFESPASTAASTN